MMFADRIIGEVTKKGADDVPLSWFGQPISGTDAIPVA